MKRSDTKTTWLMGWLLLVAYWPFSSAADAPQLRFDGLLYQSVIDYGDSEYKDVGYVTAGYGYLGPGDHLSLEAELDYMHVDYTFDQELTQWDVTLLGSYYRDSGWVYTLGGHVIDSSDDWTDGATTVFAGARYFKRYRWNLGLSGFVTRYGNYTLDFSVYQLSPRVGWSFGQRDNASFYAELQAHWIHVAEELTVEVLNSVCPKSP